jgi:hypothetical protein
MVKENNIYIYIYIDGKKRICQSVENILSVGVINIGILNV